MKRLAGLLILVLVFSSTGLAQIPPIPEPEEQQQDQQFSFFATAAPALPVAPARFTNNWTPGISIGAGTGYYRSAQLKIRIGAKYNRFPFKSGRFADIVRSYQQNLDDGDELRVSGAGQAYTSISLSAAADYTIPSSGNLKQYLLAGPMVSLVGSDSFTATTTSQGDSETTELSVVHNDIIAFGFNVGIGLRYRVSDTSNLMVGPLYTVLFTQESGDHYLLLDLGYEFGG